MNTDREMLELAAKAARLPPDGMEGGEGGPTSKGGLVWSGESQCIDWNPLIDDGDVFRLCVDLDIRLAQHVGMVIASFPFADGVNLRKTLCEEVLGDPRKASRRAAVRAAAEIGGRTP